jgi:hypothetical protein
MFGSYAPELERVVFGMTENISTFNPFKTNYHEVAQMVRDFRRAGTWRGRWITLFGPPGAHALGIRTVAAQGPADYGLIDAGR